MQFQTILGAIEGELLNNEDGVTNDEKTISRIRSYCEDLKKLKDWINQNW